MKSSECYTKEAGHEMLKIMAVVLTVIAVAVLRVIAVIKMGHIELS